MSIISLSIPQSLLEKIDATMKEQGFANRSEIVRQALRTYLSENKKLEELNGTITATITIVYRKDAHRGQIMDLQHNYSGTILTFLHTHVETDSCIEVIVAKGQAQTVRNFVQALKQNRQVSEVKLTIV